MSDMNDPDQPQHDADRVQPSERPLTVIPLPDYGRRQPPPAAAGASPIVSAFRWLFRMAFMMSIGLNFFFFMFFALNQMGSSNVGSIYARFHSGKKDASDKIAIVKVDGVIMEGMMDFPHKQIEAAATDDEVKAVVLRINSPGGSITASDELHRRLKELRDATIPGKSTNKKPIVVSMGSLAASGGYYIAMPGQTIVAERTTITGSIGVYAAFLNISGLAKDYGFGMTVIKAGEVKDSGSMFKEMKPEERKLWQEMVDHAFTQFIDVVEEGRPKLKGKLREVVIDEETTVKDDSGKDTPVHYVRRRADGGIYTADKALKYGLIDEIGYLEDALKVAAKAAGLGENYRAIVYDRPPTFTDLLLKGQAPAVAQQPDFAKLANAASPRLWFLTPQSELAGYLSLMNRE